MRAALNCEARFITREPSLPIAPVGCTNLFAFSVKDGTIAGL
jgi:hypothetical protein